MLAPDTAPLMGMFMLGNLFRECGVVTRLSNAAQNELINIVTIFLAVCIGATMSAEVFLKPQSLFIFVLGLERRWCRVRRRVWCRRGCSLKIFHLHSLPIALTGKPHLHILDPTEHAGSDFV